VAALSRAAGVRARVLTKEEEGTLAYSGAVLTADIALPDRIAVCDIGGASTEIAVGHPGTDPEWIESVDLGSVRLTTRGGDFRAEAAAALASVVPPQVDAALVVGGSARAARRLVGAELGPSELAEAIAIAEKSTPRQLSRAYGVDRARAEIVPAGLAMLAEVQKLLGVPLHVCSGGIREGAVLASLDTLAA
jgi:exopolyphosphatase/pppGpp-phosphohydrolase